MFNNNLGFGLVLVWSATVCFLQHEGEFDRNLLLKADSELLQTYMPGEGFEPAYYSTKWQRPTIQPSPGNNNLGLTLIL